MSHDHGLQTWNPTDRVSFADHDLDPHRPMAAFPVPVLIRVPAVRTPTRGPLPARRPSATATERVRSGLHRPGGARRRRRLRKEVRAVACGLFAASMFALAALLLRTSVGAAPVALRSGVFGSRVAAANRPPTVTLSIEAALGASAAPEPETAVVLPGYLLPDDGVEESSHAGG